MRFYGSAMPFPHIQGAFRQVLNADAAQCAVADGLTPGEAAMGEPLAVALHAVRRAGGLVGKSVLVTGCGPIGTLAILAARRAPDGLSKFSTDKGHFDVLFECSGSAAAVAGAVPAMRPGGTIIPLGLGGDMTLPMQAMTAKELSIKGSFRFHEEFFTGVSLMQKGLIDVKPLITHSFDIDDAMNGFEMASDRSQAMKAQITFA